MRRTILGEAARGRPVAGSRRSGPLHGPLRGPMLGRIFGVCLALSATWAAAPALAQTGDQAVGQPGSRPVNQAGSEAGDQPGGGLGTPGASGDGAPIAAGRAPPANASESMAVNLIRLLVKQGTITQASADALMQQARQETYDAHVAAVATTSEPPSGVVRVPYVPEIVRNQIREDIKQDVMAEAKAKGWATPNAIPDWVSRITWFGDFRFRDQFNGYSDSNAPQLIDYATLNAGGPVDINAITNPNGLPFLNTRKDRSNLLSLRARLGANFQINDAVSLTVRLASGSDNSPVSTTQTLGGGLTKKNIWLDQVYMTLKPLPGTQVTFGRVPNTFTHTDLLFDDNLNLDGVLASAERPVGDTGFTAFGSAGAFPLDYVSDNFPANGDAKASDRTKWLFAAQAGAKFQPGEDSWSVRGAVAYYDFDDVKGEVSSPCDLSAGVRQCSSDATRPSFMQKGNSLFLLRDIVPPANNPLNFAEPQFVGLAYDYRLVNAVLQFDAPLFGDIRGQLIGDFVRNLAYDPAAALARPIGQQPVTNFDTDQSYKSGPNAYMVKAVIGTSHRERAGDWFLSAAYKYIEPDALLDAFDDHDFHMGGTNAKGYLLTGGYYFARNTWLDARWFSANEVYGPPLAIDVLQLELQTRF